MHPKDFLAQATELLTLALKLDQPLDSLVGSFFNQSRRAGARERDAMAHMVYSVMRQRTLYEYLAQDGPGPLHRRLALLGLAGDARGDATTTTELEPGATPWRSAEFIRSALGDQELTWLDQAQLRAQAPRDSLPVAAQHNLPEWLAERLGALVGDELLTLCHALEQPAPLDLRVNLEKAKRSAVMERLTQQGLECGPTPYSPWGVRVKHKAKLHRLPEFEQGLIEVQDEGSQLIALITEAKRNETVVDFCAGGGGKTLAMGAMMRNTGRLYAYDTSAKRLEGLQPRLQKSGLTNVHPMVINDEADPRIGRMQGKIDRVLVDAPCSGLGTLRRNPALKWRVTPERLEQLVLLQQKILQAAAQLVAPGGRLVYATCSLLVEENEAIAQAFSAQHQDFKALPVGYVLERHKVPGNAALCSTDPQGLYLRLWPHLGASDGFFAALWQRR